MFEINCNNLEKWATARGHSKNLAHKEILKAWSQSKETLLDKEIMSAIHDRVTFNITHYPVYKMLEIF